MTGDVRKCINREWTSSVAFMLVLSFLWFYFLNSDVCHSLYNRSLQFKKRKIEKQPLQPHLYLFPHQLCHLLPPDSWFPDVRVRWHFSEKVTFGDYVFLEFCAHANISVMRHRIAKHNNSVLFRMSLLSTIPLILTLRVCVKEAIRKRRCTIWTSISM